MREGVAAECGEGAKQVTKEADAGVLGDVSNLYPLYFVIFMKNIYLLQKLV
jgi:hypothetical protein